MEPLAVWSDSSLVEQGCTFDFILDLANGIGDDPENDFEIKLPQDVRLQRGSVVYVDGTGFGGYVTGRSSDTEDQAYLGWTGRTWLGMFEDRCLEPPSGQIHRYASGTVAQCLEELVSTLGLSDLFEIGECEDATVSYQYARYIDGLKALMDMLASVSMRPTWAVGRDNGKTRVMLGAVKSQEVESVADSEANAVEIVRTYIPYNHIIALGDGEGTARTVINRYADSGGNISSTQSLTGLAERTLIYDYSNVDAAELAENAEQRLLEEQVFGEVSVALPDGVDAPLDDYVIGYDQRIDERVKARVEKEIVKVDGGVLTVEAEAGGVI